MNRARSSPLARAAALALALAAAPPARAQFWSQPGRGSGEQAPADVTANAPKLLEQVRIDERLGNKVPLDLQFVDWTGKPFPFRSAFDGKKPVLLSLVYYDCPMLCGLIMSGMAKAMR